MQPRYNLLFRQIEREMLPFCTEDGVGVIPYNPISGGLLSGKHSAPIIGASNPGQLDASLAAASYVLDADLKQRLDEVTRGYRMGDAAR